MTQISIPWKFVLIACYFCRASSRDLSLEVTLGDGYLALFRWRPGDTITSAGLFCADYKVSKADCDLLVKAAVDIEVQNNNIWVAMFEPVAYEAVQFLDDGSLHVEFAVFTTAGGPSAKIKQIKPDAICFSIQEHEQEHNSQPRPLGCVSGTSTSARIRGSLLSDSSYLLNAWARIGGRDERTISVPFHFPKQSDAANEAQYFLVSAAELGAGERWPHASSQRSIKLCSILFCKFIDRGEHFSYPYMMYTYYAHVKSITLTEWPRCLMGS